MRMILPAALSILVAGCQTDVRQAPILTPIAIESADQSRPFAIRSVEFSIRRGQDIGGYMPGINCAMNPERLNWSSGRFSGTNELHDRFFEELKELGYPVVGDPGRPFEREREISRAVYMVAAQVNGVEFAVCDARGFLGVPLGLRGKSWTKIRWQVRSNLTNRVVLDVETEGTAELPETSRDGMTLLVHAAFAAAVRNLAGKPEFHALASGEADAKARIAAKERRDQMAPITLQSQPLLRGPIQQRINQVRMAVPTIDMGMSHGSGFFITDDGYLLTNDHVVRDRRNVTITLAGGIEVTGEVVRTDPVRDIALVKVPIARVAALPIRAEAATVGEEVFAIGTPLDRSLSQSVTRGMVSARRLNPIAGGEAFLPMIQSDVVIQGGNSGGPLVDASGNVVAVCVSGVGDLNSGTNFFIPIGDALERLGIRIEQGAPAVTR